MRDKLKKLLLFMAVVCMVVLGTACNMTPQREIVQTEIKQTEIVETEAAQTEESSAISEDGEYNTKKEVALYIHTFNHLPSNFITKNEAEKLGWNSKEGNLDDIAPGKSIGGSHFGNYENQLPDKKGRKYFECDINYAGGYRGSERVIYSNDGLVFYTGDHYKTFEQLY